MDEVFQTNGVNEFLSLIGADSLWLELGIIDKIDLKFLKDKLENDPYKEHHRHDFLVKYILKKNSFLDYEIDKLIILLNKDTELAHSGYVLLTEKQNLTKKQFQKVAQNFGALGESAQKKLELIKLQRLFSNNLINNTEIQILIKKQLNPKIHHVILDNSLTNPIILQELMENGASKKIKKRARHFYHLLNKSIG